MKTNGDEKAIREMIDAYCDAIHAGDAKRALAPMAARVTSYELRPPLEFRDAAARNTKELDGWLATWKGPVKIELPEPEIAVDGDLAFAYGLTHMRGEKRDTGPVDLWYRLTLCFHREGGKWKVVHEHASVPFMMDGSEKAALHLRPAREH